MASVTLDFFASCEGMVLLKRRHCGGAVRHAPSSTAPPQWRRLGRH